MERIDQTKLHDPKKGINGNCLPASFASLLELPLSEIPEFEDMGEDDWHPALVEWLKGIGFTLVSYQGDVPLTGHYLAMGISERNIKHQVVFKNGELVHDPHPSRAGIKKVDEVWALIPFDPARYIIKKGLQHGKS